MSLRYLLAAVIAVVTTAFAVTAIAADPIVIELRDRPVVGTSIVTIGDVALVSGGDPATRALIAQIDLAEFKREPSVTLGRRGIEYRLTLAGIDPKTVRVVGAERATVSINKRQVTADEVTVASRVELLRVLGDTANGATIELAQPIVVKLPEVPANERVMITAKPRQKPAPGRVQMDVTIATANETLLSLAVQFEVKSPYQQTPAITSVSGTFAKPSTTPGTPFATSEFLVRARQPVEVQLNANGVFVRMSAEAQQDGRMGQTIFVQNRESKKLFPAKVVGAGRVEVELGATP